MDQKADPGLLRRRRVGGAAPTAASGSRQGPVQQALERRLQGLPVPMLLRWPGGQAGPPQAGLCVTLHRRRQLLTLLRGHIGDLADAHVRGELDIDGSMRETMAVAGALARDPVPRGALWPWWRVLSALRSRWQHRPWRDAVQVRAHYDLSDDFFALWLDPRRVYSCAYYAEPELTLAQAQEAKLDLICRKLQLAPGQRFLDIGAGWGALLLWAAQHYGVRATGITLSRHQHAHVSRLITAAGLGGRVNVQLLDYRRLPGQAQFDRIASVGMFEHVGRANLDNYFATLQRLLRPGGLLLNHGIAAGGLDYDGLGAGLGRFIDRHIFPGGELVHVAQAVQALARGGLELLDAENLRPHYARTLWAWSDRLEVQLGTARALTGEAALRAYRLYLAGSALCFERGWLSLYQLLATRSDAVASPPGWPTRSDYPFTRRHMPG
ncbi:MAG: SAM-dependent methyltransferase [Leptothrix sp. (in: Bacteria)]|nr:SAM-dependent methyltransferase [Leptothrix sp. (in: b-proteobacteria)]